MNGQHHGKQIKYSYITGKLNQYISAEENYDNGKLDGTQKKFINILHTDIIQQESEIIYDKGIALSGWMKKFDPVNGAVTQEIKLVPSPHRSDEDFYSGYPGNLVPDGVLKRTDAEGEEVWANGIKMKYSYNYGEPSFHVLESTTPREHYREVSKAQYMAYGTSLPREPGIAAAQPSVASNSESCVDEWITAYRNEAGEDVLVTSEQLGEWDDWCKAGKTP
ncbi:TPA: hypothetical protein ACXJNS_002335 [Pseudomonas aeruginosa]